jgi:hypothetical protein
MVVQNQNQRLYPKVKICTTLVKTNVGVFNLDIIQVYVIG